MVCWSVWRGGAPLFDILQSCKQLSGASTPVIATVTSLSPPDEGKERQRAHLPIPRDWFSQRVVNEGAFG